MYVCSDKEFLNSINAKTRKEFTGKAKHVKFSKEEVDAQLEVKSTDIVIKEPSLMNQLIKYVKETNKIPYHKDILCKNGSIKKCH